MLAGSPPDTVTCQHKLPNPSAASAMILSVRLSKPRTSGHGPDRRLRLPVFPGPFRALSRTIGRWRSGCGPALIARRCSGQTTPFFLRAMNTETSGATSGDRVVN